MLRSTYTPVALPPLPPGWSEHTADSGHKYYYNAETKQSTYTRPTQTLPRPASLPQPPFSTLNVPSTFGAPPAVPNVFPGQYNPQSRPDPGFSRGRGFRGRGRGSSSRGGPGSGHDGTFRHKQSPKDDRPKHKHEIPEGHPWVLVVTKLGRRFVHNLETKESLWKVPDHLMTKIVEFDRLRREGELKKTVERTEPGSGSAEKEEEPRSEVPVREPARTPTPEVLGSEELEKSQEGGPKEPPRPAIGLVGYGSEDDSDDDDQQQEESGIRTDTDTAAAGPLIIPAADAEDDESEYEEVVVGASDVEDGDEVEYEYVYEDDDQADATSPGCEAGTGQPDEPMEFTEDDIAFQLAAMEEYSDLDQDDDDDDGDDDDMVELEHYDADEKFDRMDDIGAETAAENIEANTVAFRDFLSSVQPPINPFDTFSHVLAETHPDLPLEAGYRLLTTMRDREAAYAAWSIDEVKRRRQRRMEEQAKSRSDPMAEYLSFVNAKYVGNPVIIMAGREPTWKQTKKPPYWPEVKRKYRKEPAFRDRSWFDDSDREKAYREFASLVVRSPGQLVEGLRKVMDDEFASLGESEMAMLKDIVQEQDQETDGGDVAFDEDQARSLIDALPVKLRRRCAWAAVPWRAQAILARYAIRR